MVNTWDKLRRLLSPPIFEDNEEKTRIAGLLNIILWSVLLLEILRSLSFIFIPEVDLTVSLAATVSVLIITGIPFYMMHTGRVHAATRIFLSLTWISITGINIMYGGVRGAGYVIYIEVIVVAGLLLGERDILNFAISGVVNGLGLFLLERQNIITPNPSMLRMEVAFGIVSQVFITVTVLIILYHRSFTQAIERMRRNELALTQSNRELAAMQASLEAQVAERTRNAEAARAAAEAAHQSLETQMWQVTGLAQLSDVMRNKQNILTLATAVLEQICPYLDAQVGVLYIREENSLVLAGTYAYQPPEGKTLRFAVGEGVVGQVAAEGIPHYLNRTMPIPASDAMIGTETTDKLVSSFGTITLNHIVLYPILHGETVMGVIEFGRLTRFTEVHIQLLEQALERVAVVINTVQTNERIQTLFQETQRQAEGLQMQEEELRAANEELEAQTESLRISEAQLREKQIELEALNAELRRQVSE
ncbi:MAG: GAF domain-containing protein [Anaerolineae bacterium]|nr:GAF domain-containing protein [Anaerolineae bacterium]